MYSKTQRKMVLPADAGMSLRSFPAALEAQSAPRRRGDEPHTRNVSSVTAACSPQTRG